MLKSILSPETCAECRLCCVFDRTDIWELPVLSEENVRSVKSICSSVQLAEKGAEHTFSAPELKDDELYRCPALTDKGCGLPREEMPFDCRIWPFRMMRDENGGVVIAVSQLCRGLNNKTDNELIEFLSNGLDKTIFSFAKEHPDHVKPLTDGYRVLVRFDLNR